MPVTRSGLGARSTAATLAFLRRPRNPLLVMATALVAALAVVLGAAAVVLARRGPDDSAQAAPGSLARCGDLPVQAVRESRGMTLTTVRNRDWPSAPGLPADVLKREFLAWLDVAQAQHHNAIYVHVRPSGDAFWPSDYVPWSQWLTGSLADTDPGWDPLAFMVEETHRRGIEFHAWFNPYRGAIGNDVTALPADHPLRQHPEWGVVYGSVLYYDPGNPDARRYVEDSILEAVARYDIDGVMFDDFFYPYPIAGQEFADADSYARYGGGQPLAQWRRSNVDALVQEMSQRIKQLKPWVVFGINPFGIWRNVGQDPLGSQTRGLSAYDEIYADSRRWVQEQWLDYIAPQLYWHIGFDRADYATLLAWWSRQIAGTRVRLLAGMGDYRIGEAGAWSDPEELSRQYALNAEFPVSGTIHFSAGDVRADRLGAVSRYRDTYAANVALPPAMAWLPSAPPGAPVITSSTVDSTGAVTLTWRAGAGPRPVSYAIYRYGPRDRAATLVHTLRAPDDPEAPVRWTAPAGSTPYGYCVSGLDRSWNEGPISAPFPPVD